MTQIAGFTMSSEYNDYVALVDVLDYDQQVNICMYILRKIL